jgi:hypothetical protein
MATSSIAMVRQAFPIEMANLYTVAGEIDLSVATNILVVNTKDTPERFTLRIDGVEIFDATPISANGTISIDIKQVVGTSISGFASSGLVKLHISGVEVS